MEKGLMENIEVKCPKCESNRISKEIFWGEGLGFCRQCGHLENRSEFMTAKGKDQFKRMLFNGIGALYKLHQDPNKFDTREEK